MLFRLQVQQYFRFYTVLINVTFNIISILILRQLYRNVNEDYQFNPPRNFAIWYMKIQVSRCELLLADCCSGNTLKLVFGLYPVRILAGFSLSSTALLSNWQDCMTASFQIFIYTLDMFIPFHLMSCNVCSWNRVAKSATDINVYGFIHLSLTTMRSYHSWTCESLPRQHITSLLMIVANNNASAVTAVWLVLRLRRGGGAAVNMQSRTAKKRRYLVMWIGRGANNSSP